MVNKLQRLKSVSKKGLKFSEKEKMKTINTVTGTLPTGEIGYTLRYTGDGGAEGL